MDTPRKHRKPHFKDKLPLDPGVKRWSEWNVANRDFHRDYRKWLSDSSYSESVLNIYSVVSRTVIGYLDKPYWQIDPDGDLQEIWEHLQTRSLSESTLTDYHKGLAKLGEYLRLRGHQPLKEKTVHWDYYIGSLPSWLAEDVHAFILRRRRNWKPERQHEVSISTLSHLTLFLRWMAAHFSIDRLDEITPDKWYAYLDERLEDGIQPVTLNGQLLTLQAMLSYLESENRPICQRMLRVDLLNETDQLPKDVPIDLLQRLFHEIQAEATSFHAGKQRLGLMDAAWFLLMLHSGLRTCEARSLRFEHLDLANRRLRIEQSKGLKDRQVFMTESTVEAIRSYLAVRGPKEALPDQVFIYAHKPLSRTFCWERLVTYGSRCGVQVAPHQLRHSCATLLLNAGAPVLAVQSLLGHKYVDTTLGYARLYDGTVAAGYYGAMAEVERRLKLTEDIKISAPNPGELIALVDSLRAGTLNSGQSITVQAIRDGIMALAKRETNKEAIQDVNVLADGDNSKTGLSPTA